MTLATSPHRAFPGLAIIAGAATAVAMGLLTALRERRFGFVSRAAFVRA